MVKKRVTNATRKHETLEAYGEHCCYCSKVIKEDDNSALLELLEPKSLGGTNNIYNLAVACKDCHSIMKNRHWDDEKKKYIHATNRYLRRKFFNTYNIRLHKHNYPSSKVLFSVEEYKKIEALAKEANLSVPKYIRKKLLEN